MNHMRTFGNVEGTDYHVYEIMNDQGMKAHISDLGATVVSVNIPYQQNEIDVVLGFDQAQDYFDNPACYFGGVVGRNANRIAKSTFEIEGKSYHVQSNEGDNNLHSGPDGYQLRKWTVESRDESTIILSLTSPHLDQGFPGELILTVTYELTDDNALSIKYHGRSDALTVFNPTNHSYFNLNGHESGNVMQHRLTLDSKVYSVLDDESIPTGQADVTNTPMDFTTEQVIGEQQATGYDDNYILYPANIKQKSATLVSDQTGIQMDVYTDMPCIQIYTGNGLDNVAGKDGVTYQQFAGVCLETQYEPNSVNTNMQPLIDGEKTYETIYQFSGF